jgi:hypothetical protein
MLPLAIRSAMQITGRHLLLVLIPILLILHTIYNYSKFNNSSNNYSNRTTIARPNNSTIPLLLLLLLITTAISVITVGRWVIKPKIVAIESRGTPGGNRLGYVVVSNSVDSVDNLLPSVRADRSSVHSGVTPIHSGNTFVPVSVVGDVVAHKHVSVTRRVRFVDDVVRHSYDDSGVVPVNTSGITCFSAGVDGVDAVSDDDVSIVHINVLRLLVVMFV